MKPRNLILIGVTAVIIWGALTVTRENAPTTDVTIAPLYPQLMERINGVEHIEIRTRDERTVLRKRAEKWTVENRDDFPAQLVDIKRALFELTELKVLEEKTAIPEKHALLGVDDIDGEASTSKLITVSGSSGEPYVRLLVGKQRKGGGSGTPAYYVRRAGDPQALLVEGAVEISPDPMAWLDSSIADIPSDRVRQVSLQPYQETPVVVTKHFPTDKFFELQNVPKGSTVRSKTAVSNLGAVLRGLRFTDVASDAVIDRNAVPRSILELQTFDGLVATAEQIDHADKVYFRFNFTFNGDYATATTAEGAVAEDAPQTPVPDAAEDSAKTPPSVEDEVTALNAVVAGWVFELADYKVRLFDKQFDDMIKPEEPQQPPADAPARPE